MSWQVWMPIVEKLIDAGVEYYKSDSQTQGSIAATEDVAPSDKGATILLAVEYSGDNLEEMLREALALVDGLEIRALEVKCNKVHQPVKEN